MKKIDSLLELANFNFLNCHESDFLMMVKSYSNFLKEFPVIASKVDIEKRHMMYMGGLLELSSSEDFEKRKDYFAELSRHLRSRMVATETESLPDCTLDIKGRFEMRLAESGKEYVERFIPDQLGEIKDELEIDDDKFLLDYALLITIKEENLMPDRFNRCERENCKKIFYQHTAKKKNFCSTQCSGAIRQAALREKTSKK